MGRGCLRSAHRAGREFRPGLSLTHCSRLAMWAPAPSLPVVCSTMSAENEAYQEGQQILRRLAAWEQEVMEINASDTQCKTDVLLMIAETRRQLREALSRLSGLV